MNIVLSVLLTAITYMSFPLIKILNNGSQFPKKEAHKIALWNSVILSSLFFILDSMSSDDITQWNMAPAAFYYFVNRYMLMDKNQKVENTTIPQKISYCRICGVKLLDGSKFCQKCGTEVMDDYLTNTKSEVTVEQPSKAKTNELQSEHISPIEELALLTIGLPAGITNNTKDEISIIKNTYCYCDIIIFIEFFVRDKALQLAPTKEIALKFSDNYTSTIIRETKNMIPDADQFFVDMFHNRVTLYDSIRDESEDFISVITNLASHIIHYEIDNNEYVEVKDVDFRYFGGVYENMKIKIELLNLIKSIMDITKENFENLDDYFKSL